MWPFSGGGAKTAVQNIDVRDAYERWRRGAKLIDVRSPHEYSASRIKGTKNVSPQQIQNGSTGLKQDDEVLVICASGHRSARAARQLAAAGFANVSNVHGGMHAWVRAGLPLKK